MTAPARSGAIRRRRRLRRDRALLAAAMAGGGALTGWWWADQAGVGGSGFSGWDVVGLSVGVVIGGVWLVSLARGHRRSVEVPAAAGGPPSAHSPAEVGWLLRHGRVTLDDLAATVVDLTARGFVLPFGRDGGLVLGRGRPPADLQAHEALVLDWLFADQAREADLTARRAAIRAEPDLWSDLWGRFVEAVDARGRADGLVERDVASSAVLSAGALGLGVLVAGVAGVAHGHAGWLAAVGAGAVVLAHATAVARRSPRGEALAAAWEAFGAGLRAGAPVTPHGLAYAVSLGEGDVVAGRLAADGAAWPAQLVHDDVEGHVTGWREAYLAATSIRGEPSERVRALVSLRALRRRTGLSPASS